jgi:hypothetical protein
MGSSFSIISLQKRDIFARFWGQKDKLIIWDAQKQIWVGHGWTEAIQVLAANDLITKPGPLLLHTSFNSEGATVGRSC